MKRTYAVLLAGLLCLPAGCSDYLDVNTNPNAPQSVSANLYLSPMLHWMVTSPQYDGRHVGHYTQEWISTSASFSPARTWGRMGYDPGSDNGAQQWRDVYWSLGQNLVDMNAKAEAEERWDLLGVGLILKAWGWQVLTDLHGEIVVKEAIDQSKVTFNYDSQEYAYQEVDRLLHRAIEMLQRVDGAVDQAYLARGDKIYNGDRTKWLKLAYGMLALNLFGEVISGRVAVLDFANAVRIAGQMENMFEKNCLARPAMPPESCVPHIARFDVGHKKVPPSLANSTR